MSHLGLFMILTLRTMIYNHPQRWSSFLPALQQATNGGIGMGSFMKEYFHCGTESSSCFLRKNFSSLLRRPLLLLPVGGMLLLSPMICRVFVRNHSLAFAPLREKSILCLVIYYIMYLTLYDMVYLGLASRLILCSYLKSVNFKGYIIDISGVVVLYCNHF